MGSSAFNHFPLAIAWDLDFIVEAHQDSPLWSIALFRLVPQFFFAASLEIKSHILSSRLTSYFFSGAPNLYGIYASLANRQSVSIAVKTTYYKQSAIIFKMTSRDVPCIDLISGDSGGLWVPFLFSSRTMSHHCHGESCEHDHEDAPGSGDQFLLYSRIDRDNVRCLNEAEPGTGKSTIKPWNERMDNTKVPESAYAFGHPAHT